MGGYWPREIGGARARPKRNCGQCDLSHGRQHDHAPQRGAISRHDSLQPADAARKYRRRDGWIEPEDVGAAAVFLASEDARFVSGAALDITAGLGAHYTA